MTQVRIESMQKVVDFGELFVKVTNNLLNSTGVAETATVPQAKISGSPALEAVGQDIIEVKEAITDRLSASKALQESLEDYLTQISKINAN